MTDLLLASQVRACKLCTLSTTRNLAVPAWVGKNYTGLAIMCEAPGRDEDKYGVPLIGRAGQLMDTYLATVGLERDDLLLMNRIRCRPPNNDIRSGEAISALAICDQWTEKELDVYNPRVVVLAGSTAAKPIMGTTSVFVGRGSYAQVGTRTYVYTYHPAAALRSPDLGRYIIEDLLLAKDLFNESNR